MRYTYPGLVDFEIDVDPGDPRRMIFTIHEQDSSIRTDGRRKFNFQATNGIFLHSVGHVEISGKELFLLGTNKTYGNTARCTFKDAISCQQRIDQYIEAFEELAVYKQIRRQGIAAQPEQLSLWD